MRLVLAVQGFYYVVAGLWPIVAMGLFEKVTGPKTDDWLVHMVGALAAVIGATLLLAVRHAPPSGEALFLAGASAGAFAAIDIVYAAIGRIRPIYLADAAVEILLAGAAWVGWRARRSGGA